MQRFRGGDIGSLEACPQSPQTSLKLTQGKGEHPQVEAVGSSVLARLPPPTQGREITAEGAMRLNICKKLLLVLGKEGCENKRVQRGTSGPGR